MTNIGAPDVQIDFLKAPFLQYEQILLTKNFQQYLETILVFSRVLRIGIQKTPYQKTYEMQVGSQEFTADVKRCNRQFDWLEISLIYDKSDKYLTIYDTYIVESAAKMIKCIELANISKSYSVTNTKKVTLETILKNIYSINSSWSDIATVRGLAS